MKITESALMSQWHHYQEITKIKKFKIWLQNMLLLFSSKILSLPTVLLSKTDVSFFTLSLNNDVMATSKHCVKQFLLICILKWPSVKCKCSQWNLVAT